MDQEIIVAESNIVEEMPPQVSTPVVPEVVDTPAPSVTEPVEASNVEVSKVPELDESIVAPVIAEGVVYGDEYNSGLKKLYNSDDEYDSDDEDDFIPLKPVRAVETIPVTKCVVSDDSWMYETSDNDSISDIESVISVLWDEFHDQIRDESSLEEFERARQAEAYAEYEEDFEKKVASTAAEDVKPTTEHLRKWAFLIVDANYHENRDRVEAEKLVLDSQQIDFLRKYVEADTKMNAKGKDIESILKRDSMVIDQFERKMKELKAKPSVKPKAKNKTDEFTKEITGEDEIKKIILKKIVDDMTALDKDLIRQCNKVDLYDLSSLRNVTIDVSKLALLIRQTLVRTDNNGLPMWYGKNNTKLRFGAEEVDAIEFSPVGKVFQTYKMAISYKYSPKFKPVVANLKMSVILDAVTHLVNHKSADVHPYGPFDAHKNDPRVFNLFSGFPHVYDSEYVINLDRVNVWLDHIKYVLSDSNDDVYRFFVKYFAHLIQKPHVKTKMVPLIKGTQGCGKNSAFDIFHRFVIGPQSSLVCPSMERITARFNSIRQSKLSIVLDEAFDSNNRSMNNQMKSYITDDRTQIERKGLETIEVNDYANYVILTNNDFGSIIEANDRRYMCLVASESRVGDEKYFDHYFDTLANLDAGRDIFHYLARVDLTGFKPQAFPLTKYKKELKTKQTNNVVKWLLNMHERLSDEEDDEIKEASTSEWYGKYCRWAETSGESRIMSLNVFSGLLKNEGIDTESKNILVGDKRVKFRYRTISRTVLSDQLAQYIE